MNKTKTSRILSIFLSLLLLLQQTGLAQVASSIDLSGKLAALRQSFTPEARFRPLHLRYLSYDSLNNNFKLLVDKGSDKNFKSAELESASKDLLKYFFIGLALPNDTFWVNLRPDSPDQIIDPLLAKTDIGRIMLEADVELKKDTALATSPDTKEGKEYWDRLYQKAEELYGTSEVTIPTLTRPWIVPDEVIISENQSSAYIYKATLKVMLEEDYLKSTKSALSGYSTYDFKDDRAKQLNEYSTQLIRELILPKIIQSINTGKKYANLRQVYYSLILAQWFKANHKGLSPKGTVPELIDSKDLSNLASDIPYSKDTYFKQYQKSFQNGEYKFQAPVSTPTGQYIRSYFSGGTILDLGQLPANGGLPAVKPDGASVTVQPSNGGPVLKSYLVPLLASVSLGLAGIAMSDQTNVLDLTKRSSPTGEARSIDQTNSVIERLTEPGAGINAVQSRLRTEAVKEIGKIGGDKAIKALTKPGVGINDVEYDVRVNAFYVLGKIGGDKAIEALTKPGVGINDGEPYVRECAVDALGIIGGDKVFEVITKPGVGINDEDLRVRHVAVNALGKIGGEKAVKQLIAPGVGINDKDNIVCGAAIQVIESIGGDKVFEALTAPGAGINSSNAYIRRVSVPIIFKINGKKAFELITKPGIGINDTDSHVRDYAVDALGEALDEIGGDKVFKTLTGLRVGINDPDYSVRASSVEIIGKISGDKAVEALTKPGVGINDKETWVRRKAAEALIKIGGEKALEALTKPGVGIDDKDDVLRKDVLEEIGKIGGEKAVKMLTRPDVGINSSNRYFRKIAVGIIRDIGGNKGFEALIKPGVGVNDEDYQVHDIAAELIRQFDDEKVFKALTALGVGINSSNSDVRILAIGIIGRVGGDKAIEVLTKPGAGINDEHPRVRRRAIFDLGEIGGEKAVDVLIKPGAGINDPESDVRLDAVVALGKIGGDKVFGALTSAGVGINDPESDVRKAAAEIIGREKGDKAFEALTGPGVGINDATAGVRRVAVEMVAKTGSRKAFEALTAHDVGLSDIDPDIRGAVVELLRELDGDKAIKALTRPQVGLNDADPDIRQRTVVALMNIRGVGIFEAVNSPGVGINDKDHAVRRSAVWAIAATGGDKALEALTAAGVGVNDSDPAVSLEAIKQLPDIIAESQKGATGNYKYIKYVFQYADCISDSLVEDNSRSAAVDLFTSEPLEDEMKGSKSDSPFTEFLARNSSALLDIAEGNILQAGSLNPGEFNLILYLLGLDSVGPETLAEYVVILYSHAEKESDKLTRNLYLNSLRSIFELRGDMVKPLVGSDPQLAKVISNLEKLSEPSLMPPYEDIKRSGSLNIKLYTPLTPSIYDKFFLDKGFVKAEKPGGLFTYTGAVNGKSVRIDCDPTGDPDNYNGQIFRYISDPDVHMIAYAGHTGMGASLAFALENAPSVDTLQAGRKILGIFSCSSAPVYGGQISERYPFADFIGTTTEANDVYDSIALGRIIEGLTMGLSWEEIKGSVNEAIKDAQGFRFPHETENAGPEAGVKFVPSGRVVLSDIDRFDFEIGNIDLGKISSEKVDWAVPKVGYFFRWNKYLKDYESQLAPAGFQISRTDKADLYFINEAGGRFLISVNAGYRNCSSAAMTMMLLYELNLYFSELKSGTLAAADKLRGLQMAAEFVKYYHKEALFGPFLEKYGFKDITLEDMLKTLDVYGSPDAKERADALNKVFKAMGEKEMDREAQEKMGLLSFSLPAGNALGLRQMFVGDTVEDEEIRAALLPPGRSRSKRARAPRARGAKKEAEGGDGFSGKKPGAGEPAPFAQPYIWTRAQVGDLPEEARKIWNGEIVEPAYERGRSLETLLQMCAFAEKLNQDKFGVNFSQSWDSPWRHVYDILRVMILNRIERDNPELWAKGSRIVIPLVDDTFMGSVPGFKEKAEASDRFIQEPDEDALKLIKNIVFLVRETEKEFIAHDPPIGPNMLLHQFWFLLDIAREIVASVEPLGGRGVNAQASLLERILADAFTCVKDGSADLAIERYKEALKISPECGQRIAHEIAELSFSQARDNLGPAGISVAQACDLVASSLKDHGVEDDYRSYRRSVMDASEPDVPSDPETSSDLSYPQRQLIESGKPLEFGPGLLYHGRDGLDEALMSGTIAGKIPLARAGDIWATGCFDNRSTSPAIFVFTTEFFNRLARDKKAKLTMTWQLPYPQINVPVSLDDVAQIWIDRETMHRYMRIMEHPGSDADMRLKVGVERLFNAGKIKVLASLRHADVKPDSADDKQTVRRAVSRYMRWQNLFSYKPEFREFASAAGPDNTPYEDILSGDVQRSMYRGRIVPKVFGQKQGDRNFQSMPLEELISIEFGKGRLNAGITFMDLGTGNGSFCKDFLDFLCRGLGLDAGRIRGIGVSPLAAEPVIDPVFRDASSGLRLIQAEVEALAYDPSCPPERSMDIITLNAPPIFGSRWDCRLWINAAKRLLKDDGLILIRLARSPRLLGMDSLSYQRKALLLQEVLDADEELVYEEFTENSTPIYPEGAYRVGPLILVKKSCSPIKKQYSEIPVKTRDRLLERQGEQRSGGIDFRSMPIVIRAMANLGAGAAGISMAQLKRVDLDKEWSDIEQMVSSGIAPSGERIREYLQASSVKGNLDNDADKVLACISDVLRMDEERCCPTDEVLKDVLIVLEAGRSSSELAEVLVGTEIS